MKTLSQKSRAVAATLALAAAVGFTSAANAQLITLSLGTFTIQADGFSSSNLSGTSTAPGSNAPGSSFEDSWGIFQITSILNGADTVYTSNTGIEYWGVYYGSFDTAVAGPLFNTFLFESEGLQLDIYKVDIADAGDTYWQTVYQQGIAGRIDTDEFKGITGGATGNAALDAASKSLVFQSELIDKMTSSFNTSNGNTNAEGSLAVTYNNLFDIDGGNFNELVFSLGGTTRSVPSGWTVKFGGPIEGSFTPVPEPSTYGMIGAGALLGLVVLRRRAQKRAVQA